MLSPSVLLIPLSLFYIVLAQPSSPNTLFPAAFPLAVRSPYFSSWENSTSGDIVSSWPAFSAQSSAGLLGWQGLIRVDNSVYRWLGWNSADSGAPTSPGNLMDVQITPTRTIYTVRAGPMNVTATFLTPIEPSDWVRQSMPFSYISVNVSVVDGNSHSVQMYSDISAEWLSGNRSALVKWNTVPSATNVYHVIELQEPLPFTEISNQAEDGTAYYCMSNAQNPSYQTGQDSTVRGQFIQNGQLTNGQDENFRAISDDFPVFGISVDLGSIQSTTSPIVWAVGYVRDPSINYTTGKGETQLRSPYYATQYSTIDDVIDAFLTDFDDAMTRSLAVDNELASAASAISQNYTDLVTLAARQTFGGIDTTVANGTDGNWNISDTMIFMKDIGVSSRVNPVEVLYAAFPIFLYLNASFAKRLLAPLFDFQDSALYTLPYAASDIGGNYPIASGDDSSSSEGVEQSGNMLIMTLAHARATGDGSLISQHYNLLKDWASFLGENSKAPTNQISADGQSDANMTNLAIKGIIGIKAMSDISLALGKTGDAEQFSFIATEYADSWQTWAMSSSSTQKGLLYTYGGEGTWALIYNLYADRLLQTNLVSESIYDVEAEYYMALATGGLGAFGLPIDSASSGQANSAWLAFTAASVSNTTIRDVLLDLAWTHAAYNGTSGVFPTEYLADTGVGTSGYASPAQGAMFAPLALSISNQIIKVPPLASESITTGKHVAVGAIIGGVIGGVGGLLAMLFLWRWKRQARARIGKENMNNMSRDPLGLEPFPYGNSPSLPLQDVAMNPESMRQTQISPRKASERLRSLEQAHPQSAPSSPASASIESISSAGPPSRSPTGVMSPNEIIGLRTEVENLRRVMQELHAERLEPPPEYVYED